MSNYTYIYNTEKRPDSCGDIVIAFYTYLCRPAERPVSIQAYRHARSHDYMCGNIQGFKHVFLQARSVSKGEEDKSEDKAHAADEERYHGIDTRHINGEEKLPLISPVDSHYWEPVGSHLE